MPLKMDKPAHTLPVHTGLQQQFSKKQVGVCFLHIGYFFPQ